MRARYFFLPKKKEKKSDMCHDMGFIKGFINLSRGILTIWYGLAEKEAKTDLWVWSYV